MKSARLLLLLAAAPLTAQTTTPAHTAPSTTLTTHSTATHPAAAKTNCAKLPDISPKVPALPAGLPCAKPLYTITTLSPVKLEDVSPMVSQDELRKTLGIETNTITLAYIDTKIGTGALAAPHKWYTIKYAGYLTDGTKFDSSADHPNDPPFSIAYGEHQVIPGWDTGFDGMRVGGKRRLFIPYQLAYGPNGKPAPQGQVSIPPKAELIFDVELVAQNDQKPTPPAPPTPPPTAAPAAKPATPAPAPAAPPATPPPPTAPKP